LALRSDDIVEQVNGLVAMFQPLAEKKKLELRGVIGPGVPRNVEYDPARFGQIVNNLVGNAIKFTQRGSVSIRLDWLPVVGDSKEQIAVLIDQATNKVSRDALADSSEGITR
jgi:two-component system capsular synthesis sensor histidine kinase RcsC